MENHDEASGVGPRPGVTAWQMWLISHDSDVSWGVLRAAGDDTLPVFSFEEEAEMFLHLGGFGEGWRVRRVTSRELASLLEGPSCAGVTRVALDPLPGAHGKALMGLVSVDRPDFVRSMLGAREPSAAGAVPSPGVEPVLVFGA